MDEGKYSFLHPFSYIILNLIQKNIFIKLSLFPLLIRYKSKYIKCEVIGLKKPSSMLQFWSYIFIVLSLSFLAFAYLKGDLSVLFPAIGFISLIMGLIILSLSLYMENKRKRLMEWGLKVDGTVSKVKKINYARWKRVSPHVVYFYYERYGFRYEGKSFLIWDKPNVDKGEKIDVYINDNKREHYFIKI